MKEKAKISYVSSELVIFLVLLAAVVFVLMLIQHMYLRMAILVVVFVIAVLYFVISTMNKQRWFYTAAQILTSCSEKIDKYVNAVTIPTAITKENGVIGWHNPAFFMLAGMHCEGKNIFRVFPQLQKPEKDKKVKIQGKTYYKETIGCEWGGKAYTIYRLIDFDKTYEASALSKASLVTICHIQVDNYGDLLRGTQQSTHAEINAEIEQVVSKNVKNVHGAYQKYDRDKFVWMFERRFLSSLMQGKFEILNEIRRINTGNDAFHPTISVGTGVGLSPEEANDNATAALELALARGGDQAVIKDEAGYKFYGGAQQGMEKRTRVKSRMFAHALKNMMEQCDKVVIMGHDVPDLDCMGAAMGLLACARQVEKKAVIVLDKPNAAIQGLVDEIGRDPQYKGLLVTPQEAAAMVDSKTMLIVVDTQIEEFVIAPALLHKAEIIVVIDHHLRGTNHIENPTLYLHEPYASSTAEMVTEIIQYFADKVHVRPLEVEALLAGITIDTKGFSFKTGVRTFEAASYLRKLGADTTSIRHLFQDDLDTFNARAKVVQNADILPEGIAISWCPGDAKNPQLLAAQAADSLIGIRGISASFVLCEQNDKVLISGRSIGSINVQRILEKLGGGGHATIAGAQIRGISKQQVMEDLKEAIEEYKKES